MAISRASSVRKTSGRSGSYLNGSVLTASTAGRGTSSTCKSQAHRHMNTPLPPVIVTIPREAVESRDPFPVVDVLESWIPELCERNRNRVQFQILGYDEDSRELYDIPEVREYYRELYNRHPGLFYWI